ncbi:MAG TPA: winged helix-turn-helix domain-containing protein [Verrucomicrobiae bacterium]|nr:winged helix-turn-helix domain-containing protein [Verrucomicrobiae bacterium]
MITWIGLCAGEIWRYLDSHEGTASLKELCKGIKAPQETILMATGWLSREGYVLIDGRLPDPLITLNPKPPSHR